MKNIHFLTVSLCLLVVSGFAQTPKEKEPVFTIVEQMPEYPGGNEAMTKFIADNLVYPEDSKAKGIQGKVYVSMVITEKGEVTEPKVLRAPTPEMGTEALRILALMPNWKPGMQNGKAVKVQFNIPVSFKLP